MTRPVDAGSGKIAPVHRVWSRLFGDMPLRDRRITKYGVRYVAWFPALIMGLAFTAFGVGTVVDGAIGWNTLGYLAAGIALLGFFWLLITSDPPADA
jgi:hypothetical protein